MPWRKPGVGVVEAGETPRFITSRPRPRVWEAGAGLLCSKHGPPIRTGAPTGTQVEAGGSIATTNRLSHYQEAGGWFAWTTPGSQVDASGRAHFSAAKTTASDPATLLIITFIVIVNNLNRLI